MRILQIGKFYPIRGGVEKVMWDLTKGLGEEGVECDMLCAKLPQDRADFKDRSFAELGKAETEEGKYPAGTLVLKFNEYSKVVCVPAKKKVAATMISPAMVRTLKRMIKAAKREGRPYDIVHVHHPDPMAALALRFSHFRGRVVLHWHSDIIRQKTMLKLYKPLQNWLIRRADKVVGTTPVYVAESPHLRKAQDKVDYLPIGIHHQHPDPEKVAKIRNAYQGKKIVFSLGRLVPYKGYEYLIDAISHLPEEYVLVLGGKGPLHSQLQNKAAELGICKRVELLGWISDEDAASWFGACDVFVLSSIWKTEAFAIVQAEAMSCGKPVVATKIPASGVSWVNADGYSGLNVPVEDGRALADAVLEITSSEEVYRGYSRRALQRYEDMFTYSRMIEGCIDIYRSLL